MVLFTGADTTPWLKKKRPFWGRKTLLPCGQQSKRYKNFTVSTWKRFCEDDVCTIAKWKKGKQNFASMSTVKLTAAAGKAGEKCEICNTWNSVWLLTAHLYKTQAFPLTLMAEKKSWWKKTDARKHAAALNSRKLLQCLSGHSRLAANSRFPVMFCSTLCSVPLTGALIKKYYEASPVAPNGSNSTRNPGFWSSAQTCLFIVEHASQLCTLAKGEKEDDVESGKHFIIIKCWIYI